MAAQANIQKLNWFVKRLFEEIKLRGLSETVLELSKLNQFDASETVAYWYDTTIPDVFFEVYYGPMLSDGKSVLWYGLGTDSHDALQRYKSEAGGIFKIEYELSHQDGERGLIYDQVAKIPPDFLQGYGYEANDEHEWIGRYAFDENTYHVAACDLIEQVLAVQNLTDLDGLSKIQLREKADEALKEPRPKVGTRVLYGRSAVVRAYVLDRANGHCENCAEKAPFNRKDGSGYLESHHIDRRADEGLDDYRVMAGICPTCHRRIHHGEDGAAINDQLRSKIAEKEAAL